MKKLLMITFCLFIIPAFGYTFKNVDDGWHYFGPGDTLCASITYNANDTKYMGMYIYGRAHPYFPVCPAKKITPILIKSYYDDKLFTTRTGEGLIKYGIKYPNGAKWKFFDIWWDTANNVKDEWWFFWGQDHPKDKIKSQMLCYTNLAKKGDISAIYDIKFDTKFMGVF